MNLDKLKGMLVGLAIGDALGMPLEFKQQGTFEPLQTLQEGGPFNLPLGYWTDDTSMALCLADSIIAERGYNSYDVMDKYTAWRDTGYRSSTGECFDIGNQVSAAIQRYKTKPEIAASETRTESAGNGCIMRLAPLLIASISSGNSIETAMRLASISARETHFSELAEEATALFAGMLFNAVKATSKDRVLQFDSLELLDSKVIETVSRASQKTEKNLKPTGFVLDTLEVAVWAFMTTDNFRDGSLKAINMGGDSDTIGAVYGQLAGAYYGLKGIPQEWLDQLHDYNEIINIAGLLSEVKEFDLILTRFKEDRGTGIQKQHDQSSSPASSNLIQNILTKDEVAGLQSWGNVGSPGPAPIVPFKPSDEKRLSFKPISMPKTISVNWNLYEEQYEKLRLGHLAQEMEDKWNIYTEEDVVHFHRSWTGMETFRFIIQHGDESRYSIRQFEVEQNPENYKGTDERSIVISLLEVLRAVLGIRFDD